MEAFGTMDLLRIRKQLNNYDATHEQQRSEPAQVELKGSLCGNSTFCFDGRVLFAQLKWTFHRSSFRSFGADQWLAVRIATYSTNVEKRVDVSLELFLFMIECVFAPAIRSPRHAIVAGKR